MTETQCRLCVENWLYVLLIQVLLIVESDVARCIHALFTGERVGEFPVNYVVVCENVGRFARLIYNDGKALSVPESHSTED